MEIGIGAGCFAGAFASLAYARAPRLCVRSAPEDPPPQRNAGPDRLDQSERPGTLQEAVDGSQRTGARKGKDKHMMAILQRVARQHGGDREQSK